MPSLKFQLLIICSTLTSMFTPSVSAQDAHAAKLRVIVLSDIENEPDDAESLVRFLTYINRWDVEGIIATTSIHQKDRIADARMHEIVAAYGKVRDNLALHEPGYPQAEYLQRIIKKGFPSFGMNAVGKDKDSEGSEWIINALDKPDNRPLWVLVWGGPNCLAQAMWKLKSTRPPDQVAALVSKLRVYTISDQDDSGPWLRKTFPGLFYIVSPGIHSRNAYHYATWTGISGDGRHRFGGADSSIISNQWLLENVRTNHGPLGAEYPAWAFIMEGDTPSFLYLIDNGLGDPEHPDYGSWGGRYNFELPPYRKWFSEPETRPIWTNIADEVKGIDGQYYRTDQATIWRWRSAYQNDFAARMDWCVKAYKDANHPPQPALPDGNQRTVRSGDTVFLSAAGSRDPDGNRLSYRWSWYPEAGTFATNKSFQLRDADRLRAWFVAPAVFSPETIHIILSVTDDGIPALTRYKRVIVSVIPNEVSNK
jgi:Protein of unknown function (DUF1593)